MTEAVQPLCVLYPHEHLQDGKPSERITSCGRPTMDVEITVRDADGNPLRAGEIGEIAIAHRGIGEVAFWRRPDLEREAIRDGWYYSGDLGRFDDEGFLCIVGRNKDMMISGGFNVYAREVEDAVQAHPGVAEVAVLGLPDAQWGEVVAAFVVRRPGQGVDADVLSKRRGDRRLQETARHRIGRCAAAQPGRQGDRERSARRLPGAPYPRSDFQMNTTTETSRLATGEWADDLQELAQRRVIARQLGGEEQVARHRPISAARPSPAWPG